MVYLLNLIRCSEYNACPMPILSFREIPKDIKEFYKDLKGIFYSLGDTKKGARVNKDTKMERTFTKCEKWFENIMNVYQVRRYGSIN